MRIDKKSKLYYRKRKYLLSTNTSVISQNTTKKYKNISNK